ncbi:MAG: hypothetical protein V5A68_06950 [Candidatus Thermoplasmatota archaeon]
MKSKFTKSTFLKVKIGKNVTPERIEKACKHLNQTGFYDIKIKKRTNTKICE